MAPFDAALLTSAIVIATPLMLAATGELIAEKAGVLNIGLEGMMLTGAFAAYLVVRETGSPIVGFAGGTAGGLLAGAIMAGLSINARADQIVVGVGINLLAFGLTAFVNLEMFGSGTQQPVATLRDVRIPVLADLGGVGKALFEQDVIVYLALVLLVAASFLIYRTTWGVSLRAVGEDPEAADASGVSVAAVRWWATLIAAGMAGFAGAYLSIGDIGVFRDGMSSGLGFLAIVAVVFGRWRPAPMLAACLLLAGTDALQLRLQGLPEVPDAVWYVAAATTLVVVLLTARGSAAAPRDLPRLQYLTAFAVVGGFVVLALSKASITIPSSLWLAAPFVLGLVALVSVGAGRSAAPAALALPYKRGHD